MVSAPDAPWDNPADVVLLLILLFIFLTMPAYAAAIVLMFTFGRIEVRISRGRVIIWKGVGRVGFRKKFSAGQLRAFDRLRSVGGEAVIEMELRQWLSRRRRDFVKQLVWELLSLPELTRGPQQEERGQAQRLLARPPRGASVRRIGEKVILRASMRSPVGIALVPFVLLSILVGWYLRSLSPRDPQEWQYQWLLLPLALTALLDISPSQ